MSTSRKVGGATFMIISVAVVIACIAGVVGAWQLNSSLKGGIDRAFAGVDGALGAADDALGLVDARVEEARQLVDDFDTAVTDAGDAFINEPLVLNSLADLLDIDTAPSIQRIQEGVQSVREVAAGIGEVAEAIESLPFVDAGSDDTPLLDAMASSSDSLDQALEEAEQGIRDAKEGSVTRLTDRIGQATGRVDDSLAEIESTVDSYQDRVSGRRDEMRALQDQLHFWLNTVAIIATVALLWLAISQGFVFVFGLSLYRGENLFDRWLAPPKEE